MTPGHTGRRRRTGLIHLVAVVSLVGAACTGGDGPLGSGDSSTTTPPSAGASPPGTGTTVAGGACWTADPTGDGDPRLVDATDHLGLDSLLVGVMGHAVALGDANGDGWPDLFVGGFADRPADDYRRRGASGAAPDRVLLGGPEGFIEGPALGWGRTSGAVFADLDGDGWDDLVVARNHRPDNRNDEVDLDPSMAFRNEGSVWTAIDLPIADLGARAVVPVPQSGGLPDLFVTEDHWSGGSSVYLRNLGDFEFVDATDEVGLPPDLDGYGAVAVDLDGDGHSDLFVAGSNRLFAGSADGFSEVDAGDFTWEGSSAEDDVTGVTVADLDRDGRPDLVLGHHFNSILEGAPPQPIRVFLNRSEPGRWSFEELGGLDPLPTKSPHVEIVDVDQDGWPDLVTTAASEDGSPVWFRSLGDGDGTLRFARIGTPGPAQYWVTGVAADFSRTGRVEVVFLEWDPALTSMAWRAAGTTGGWVSVDAPLGARVEVRSPEGTGLGHAGGSSGYAAGSGRTVRFGVGGADSVEVTVRRPDGSPPSVVSIPANQALATEGCP